MHQDAAWYVGLCPGDFVLDLDPAPTPKGLGLRDVVFDVDPATPRKGHTHPYPIFGLCLLWPDGWMDEEAALYGSRPRAKVTLY